MTLRELAFSLQSGAKGKPDCAGNSVSGVSGVCIRRLLSASKLQEDHYTTGLWDQRIYLGNEKARDKILSRFIREFCESFGSHKDR